MNAAQPPVQQGDIVAGKYRVERVLGMGGMGVVVAATHLDLLEPRALKFLLPTALPDAEAVERFLREARAASRLKSEHVARVYDVGRLADGTPYMVMEHLEGADLGATLRQGGALPIEEALLYVLQACEALAEAHGSGIIHRDLKPSNLFLTRQPDGTPCVKVLDFGISKITSTAEGSLDVTRTTALLGSPHYMSPEQMQSARTVDVRSDIWSLGVILYQLLTRRLPFRGRGVTEVVAEVMMGELVPPSRLAPHLPPGLEAVILRCLERDAAARFANVGELARSLQPFAPPFASFTIERIARLVAAPPRSAPSLSQGAHDSSIFSVSGFTARPYATATPMPGAHPLAPPPGNLGASTPDAVTPFDPRAPLSQPSVTATGTFQGTARGATSSDPRRSRTTIVVAVTTAATLSTILAIITWNVARGGPSIATRSTVTAAASPPGTAPALAAPEPTALPSPSPSATASAATSPDASGAPSASAPKPPKPRYADPFGMERK